MRCNLCHRKFKNRFIYIPLINEGGKGAEWHFERNQSYAMSDNNTNHYHSGTNNGVYMCKSCDTFRARVVLPKYLPQEQIKRFILRVLEKGKNGQAI